MWIPSAHSPAVYLMILLLIAAASASTFETEDDNSDNRVDLRNMEDYGRALRVLQRILNKVDETPGSDEVELKTPFRKRTCYFNGGMSHSCDYKELLKSVNDANYWSSEYTPGRRRKRQIVPLLPQPSVLI